MPDPRAHRHARTMRGDRITYCCGCVNEVLDSGVLRSASKCDPHSRERRDPATLGREYFEGLGCIVDGIPQCARYIAELRDVLGRFRPRNLVGNAIEVGCGCSMYAPALIATHERVYGVEPSEWAAKWTESTFGIYVSAKPFEEFESVAGSYSTILAAHSLEHMPDAPAAIVKCAQLLEPGGELWVIVPNDDDPLNPDHNWTFSDSSLRRCVESAGLTVLKLESRRRIEREAFLYLRARKA